MHRFHEGDVRQNRFFVGRCHIGHEADGADTILDGVEQGEAGEDADGQLLFDRCQRRPGRNVIAERHLFGQPEI